MLVPVRACGPGRPARRPSLLPSSVREGARALRRNRAAWAVVLSSASFVCFLGTVNLTELVLVRNTLHGGAGAYAIAVATMAFGFTAGSLIAGRSGSPSAGRRLYLGGIGACAAGMAGCALAATVPMAFIAFLAIGLGNGIALVSENVILQQLIPHGIKGRVFGLKSAMIAGGFLTSYVAGGLVVDAIGPRATFGMLAAGSALVLAIARAALAPSRFQRLPPVLATG
jgi:MFS family permease